MIETIWGLPGDQQRRPLGHLPMPELYTLPPDCPGSSSSIRGSDSGQQGVRTGVGCGVRESGGHGHVHALPRRNPHPWHISSTPGPSSPEQQRTSSGGAADSGQRRWDSHFQVANSQPTQVFPSSVLRARVFFLDAVNRGQVQHIQQAASSAALHCSCCVPTTSLFRSRHPARKHRNHACPHGGCPS